VDVLGPQSIVDGVSEQCGHYNAKTQIVTAVHGICSNCRLQLVTQHLSVMCNVHCLSSHLIP
jgi:hypothetical protein